ncbi:MAG: sugar-binding protein [Clostridiales Family XIII bacterium]|jgi:putative multiple sugar transport system substrate-binding protein|nr:sugar-binding protein [Clostridiales Family XIII bacterium]
MRRNIKKILVLMMAVMLVFAMTACGSKDEGTDASGDADQESAQKIGVSMPTQSLQRWNQDGSNMKEQLEAAGYEVDLQFAGDNDIPTQVSQIENMMSAGCSVLVIAPINAEALSDVLADAKGKGIQVISYDRLIMNTDAVSYYATFDNWQVGTMQGQYIADTLDLENTDGPYNIELFTGSPDDNNINFFFGGALEVLQPYIDSGKLVIKSGQTEKAQCATQDWSTEVAQKRMENLITSQNYGPDKTKLDAVLSNNDSIAQGVANALISVAGYKAGSEDFPIITGQDCDKASMKNMLAGTQAMSVFKDTRTLAAQVVTMVDAILKGGEPTINDSETYDNNNGIIPSYLCEPVVVTLDNYKEMLIDSGYYTEADLATE